MNKSVHHIIWILAAVVFFLQGCIHEYPVPVGDLGVGEDPAKVQGYIELTYNLSWEKLIHTLDFPTKAGRGKTHRFTVEVTHEGNPVMHFVEYIDDEEFATGRFRRKLSLPLEPDKYEIAAWYDREDDNGNTYFNADNLSNVSITNASTTDTLAFHCASVADILDLRGYATSNKTATVLKELEMQIPVARIQVVATDVQEFIIQQKEALNQGDKFTVHLSFSNLAHDIYDAFSHQSSHSDTPYELSGWMRLPFAEYQELTIGQGMVFCHLPEDISMQISVSNSGLTTVSQTDYISFPIKPGHITVIKGDFLTHPVDGIFKIDHIWEGEIIYEI